MRINPVMIMYKLMATSRQLNDLLIHTGEDLELNDLIKLNDINEKFEHEIGEIEFRARELSERIHQMILDSGKDARETLDRRISGPRRMDERRAS
jgi:hypothetical protein